MRHVRARGTAWLLAAGLTVGIAAHVAAAPAERGRSDDPSAARVGDRAPAGVNDRTPAHEGESSRARLLESALARTSAPPPATPGRSLLAPSPALSFSDTFDRAELIDEMLKECRGIAYNAYELAQTSGEALWRPAPIQLLVIRVRHPFCAELLRTYAPRTGV
jgi:hypothetical protein